MKKYIPQFGIIETTLKCNFNCLHCGSGAGKERDNELALDEISKLLKEIKQLGGLSVSYMGGEFFLRPDWLDILKMTVDVGLEFAIATNGYFINKTKIKILKQLGISSLSFSLDGASEKQHDEIRGKKNAFKRVINGIHLAAQNNINTEVYTCINKKNITQLPNILNLLVEQNIPLYWKILLASNHSNKFSKDIELDEKDYLEIADFISNNKLIYNNKSKIFISESHDMGYCSNKYSNLTTDFAKTGCLGGIKHFGIQSNGNVKGCLSLQDDFIEGNIRDRSFTEIWQDSNNFSYSRKFDKSLLEGICKNCPNALSGECKGGCRDFSHSKTGSMFSTAFCLYHAENKT